MPAIAYDHVEPAPNFDRLPLAMTFKTSRASAVVKLLMLAPAMAALAVPATLLAVHAVAEPSTLSVISDRPLASVQVLLGLSLWTGLFLWPIKRIAARMGLSRRVRISGGKVEVIDVSLLGSRSWTAPLSSYAGIAHHVRASLSGLRHELVLVHADPARDTLIAIADRIPQSAVDKAKALLGLPEIPAKALYDRALLADLPLAVAARPLRVVANAA